MTANERDLDFLIGYCAAITSVRYVDHEGVERVATAAWLAKQLDNYAVAAPQHGIEGDVIGGRTTNGYTVSDTPSGKPAVTEPTS